MRNISTKLVIVAATLMAAFPALAQEAAHAASGDSIGMGLKALGAGLGIGIAALGGALGQSRATATALDGIARNPGAYNKIFIPMILGLVLIETLVIYALVITYKLL